MPFALPVVISVYVLASTPFLPGPRGTPFLTSSSSFHAHLYPAEHHSSPLSTSAGPRLPGAMAAMELKLELDSSFAFDGPTFSGGGEHGYSSASSFSSTSPTTDPFTPISGRSSPPYADVPADLDLSYYADGLPYCVTPPPTAAPGYFAMGSKMGLETDSKLDFQAPEGFYGTPPSFTDLSGLAFAEAGAMCSTPPQQTLYFGPMGDGAATTPGSMTPTSAYMLSGHHRMDAQPDLWHSDMDVGKPLAMFETLPPTGALPSPTPPRIANAVRRLFLDDAQQTSAHLQRQLLSNGAPRSQPKRNKGGKAVLPLGFEVSKVESPTHPCLHPDCHGSKRFKRLEHLKRHAKT